MVSVIVWGRMNGGFKVWVPKNGGIPTIVGWYMGRVVGVHGIGSKYVVML